MGLDRDVRIVHMQGVIVQRGLWGNPDALGTCYRHAAALVVTLRSTVYAEKTAHCLGFRISNMRDDETGLVIVG